MQDLFTRIMEENLTRCSHETPRKSNLLEGPVLKETKENIVLDKKETDKNTKKIFCSLKQQEDEDIDGTKLHVFQPDFTLCNDAYLCKNDCIINNENNSSTCYSHRRKENNDVSLKSSDLSYFKSSVLHKISCDAHKTKGTLPTQDLVLLEKQGVLTGDDENETKCNLEKYVSLRNVLKNLKSVNDIPSVLPESQVKAVNKNNEEDSVHNKIVDGELNVKCEGKTKEIHTSNNNLSQCLSNFVAEEVRETSGVRGSSIKSRKEFLCSYGNKYEPEWKDENHENISRDSRTINITPSDQKCQTSINKNYTEKKNIQFENKIIVDGNEMNLKSEGKVDGIENSSGYLSQCISNSVAEGGGGGEQSTDISDNCLKNTNKLLRSYGDGNDTQNPLKKNSLSKIQEAERTQNHIRYLLNKLPELAKFFNLHKKIGVGTFSSVFLGSIKKDVAYRFPELKDRKFAVKHLVPTLIPERIARELKYLHKIGGKDNVIGVDLSFRNGDCVVFIMPYLSHRTFSEYVLDMDAEEARDYMCNLMIALKRVHSFNVIHRDIKPSNFLYNRELKRYLLVDFGLSQNVHPQAKWTAEKAKKRKRQEENCNENVQKSNQTLSRQSSMDSKMKRMALLPRSGEENVVQNYNCISRIVKRPRLNDPYGRVQKMMDHIYQQKMPENNRSPLTPKMSNQQNLPASQNFKLPYSSPKVAEKEMNIKKKLFTSSNEKEQSKDCLVAAETDSPAKLSLFSLRRATQSSMTSKSSSFMQHSNANLHITTPNSPAQQNEPSKQKFQTLVPKPNKDGNHTGSTLVRVQNSQVKSQMLKPLSPLESEQQRKLLFQRQKNKKLPQSFKDPKCFCKGLPQVCNVCLNQPAFPVPRAGTPGFRPPEVLLKYPMQTTAVDMWAAGVIMLCILSGCYPFFRSPDDITGLAEIMTVFGTENIKQVAKSLGRTVQCSHDKPPLDLRKLCMRLRRRRRERANGVPDNTNTLPICPQCENSIEVEYGGCLCLKSDSTSCIDEFPSSAYDLLMKLLDLNPFTRISAEEALQHAFLRGE